MSDSTTYDPSAVDGETSYTSQYASKRDIKYLIIGFCSLVVLLYPIYLIMKGNSDKTRCGTNLHQIYQAINYYALDHDDRFPPLYAANSNGQPYIDQTNLPYTWVSDVSQHLSARASFECPGAQSSEQASQQSNSGKTIKSSYGLYAPYGGIARFDVENPDSAILIVETSNHGSLNSYDPIPFESPNDGFVAAWSDSNTVASKNSASITRLAFRNTADGAFSADGGSRHANGLHFITASGEKKYWGPSSALTEIREGMPSGIWSVPISGRRR